MPLGDVKGDLADPAGAEGIGCNGGDGDVHWGTVGERGVQGGDGGGLDRNNPGPARHGRRHAGEQATPTDGDHDDLDVRVVVEELLGDRSRAGGDLDLVVGVTEQGAVVAGEADGRLVRLGVLGADSPSQSDRAAEPSLPGLKRERGLAGSGPGRG